MKRTSRSRRTARRRRERPVHRHYPGTLFYPLGDADGRVTPIGPVRATFFQEIVPRYELSTNATRDAGVGPMFDAPMEWSERVRRVRVEVATESDEEPRRRALGKGIGESLDLDA